MNKEEIEEYIWNLSLHGSRWLAEELYKLQQENQKLEKQLEVGEEQYNNLVEEKEELKALYDSTILENKRLNKQLDYLRSGEYYNQLKFERDVLQDIVNKGKVSKDDKTYIDCTHRNTELLEENQKYKEVINKAIKFIEDDYYSLNTTDINSIAITSDKLLKVREMLKEVE